MERDFGAMNDKLKIFFRAWVPHPLQERIAQGLGRATRFRGRYASWCEARAASTGYDAAEILTRADAATREVVAGRALYEQDTVLFHHRSPPFQILYGLTYAAFRHGPRLRVIDFGGALGSLYFRCRPYLRDIESINWTVIEQPHIVEHGQKHFSSGELQFRASLADCRGDPAASVVLLSGVLQYLENPNQLLATVVTSKYGMVIIDRTPFSGTGRTELTVEIVPRQIYRASYPSWIFARSSILAPLLERYQILAEFNGADGCIRSGGLTAHYRGVIAGLAGDAPQ